MKFNLKRKVLITTAVTTTLLNGFCNLNAYGSVKNTSINDFRFERNEVLEEFDRYAFESIADKVIVGATNEDGTADLHKITFVYKTGFDDK